MIINLRDDQLNEINKSYLMEQLKGAIEELHAFSDTCLQVEQETDSTITLTADGALKLYLTVDDYTFNLADENEILLTGMVEKNQNNFEYTLANHIVNYITNQYL